MNKQYFTYILSNRSGTLYIGVTNDIYRRMQEHQNGKGSKFTNKYKIHRLIHVDFFDNPIDAISREKELKGWSRKKKLDLIKENNPQMIDLFAAEFDL